MIHVLFDFEIDTTQPKLYPNEFYNKIRSFYSERYNGQSLLVDIMERWDLFPIMMLSFTKLGIESAPLDIPDFIARILHMTITQQDFDGLKEDLAMWCIDRT